MNALIQQTSNQLKLLDELNIIDRKACNKTVVACLYNGFL